MKKRYTFGFTSAALVLVVLSLELKFVSVQEGAPLARKLLFFLLLNLNIAALALLAFFVGRAVLVLYRERKAQVLGHKFKTKIVLIFVVLTSIPAMLLFLVASGLGTNYIERIFTPQFRKPLESSVKVAKAMYEAEKRRALAVAALVAAGLEPPAGYKVLRYATLPEGAVGAIKEAFLTNAPASEVISGASGTSADIIRAAMPLKDSKKGGGSLLLRPLCLLP